jgi:hypothetical protein
MPTRFDPALALRAGAFDAAALWATWCVRRSFFPLVWIGIMGALLSGETGELDVARYQQPAEFVAALLSPLFGVVLALAARILANGSGFVLAYPLAHGLVVPEDEGRRFSALRVQLWVDRVHLARGLRALRWTRAVRDRAARRLPRWGWLLLRCDQVLRIANPVLFVGMFLVAAAQGR